MLFVHLVYNWHKACDKCGMPADERVNNLWALYYYLVKDVLFDRFPAPGMYIKGIPIVTYCGILQNCCTHICLYNISSKCSYNAHSMFHHLCVNLFSALYSSKDPHKLGCPKAADILKIMVDIITIENYKNHTDLNFHLETTFKPLYPYQ